jgi:hypothetical protein
MDKICNSLEKKLDIKHANIIKLLKYLIEYLIKIKSIFRDCYTFYLMFKKVIGFIWLLRKLIK